MFLVLNENVYYFKKRYFLDGIKEIDYISLILYEGII